MVARSWGLRPVLGRCPAGRGAPLEAAYAARSRAGVRVPDLPLLLPDWQQLAATGSRPWRVMPPMGRPPPRNRVDGHTLGFEPSALRRAFRSFCVAARHITSGEAVQHCLYGRPVAWPSRRGAGRWKPRPRDTACPARLMAGCLNLSQVTRVRSPCGVRHPLGGITQTGEPELLIDPPPGGCIAWPLRPWVRFRRLHRREAGSSPAGAATAR